MFKPAIFASAFPLSGGPVSPAQILAFHRTQFGDARMEDAPDAAKVAADKAAAEKAAADAASKGSEFVDPDTGEKYAFPDKTATADMTPDQRAEYWRHKARKHEDASKSRGDYDAVVAERDRLKAATQTDAEKAVETAKQEAAAAALATARSEFAPKLVQAKLEAALAGKIPAEKIAEHVEYLDHTKFLTSAGEVDADKVSQYAAGLAPAGGWPDMGQGNRRSTAAKGVSAGADLFAASRGKKTS